jgi:glycosyltransferase involved in cell wall biosynthesis
VIHTARTGRPIRVAFCIDNMNVGGTELNAVRTAERLDRSRYSLRVASLQAEGPLLARYAALGVEVRAFPLSNLYGAGALRRGRELAAWLRAGEVDVLHAHDSYSNIFAVPWARVAGVRTIASRRWWEGSPGLHRRAAARAGYALADAVLANSPGVGELLRREGVRARKIAVVPNFLDEHAFAVPSPEQRTALRAELGLEDRHRAIGIVANLLPIKDHASLLRAVSRLAPVARCPSRSGGRGAGAGRAGEARRGARDPGPGDVRGEAVQRSQSPSPLGGFGAELGERRTAEQRARSDGRGTSGRGHRRGRHRGRGGSRHHGWLVPARDPARLADAIESLLSDPAAAAVMGAAGRARALERHTPEVALRELDALYQRLAPRIAGDGGSRVVPSPLSPALQ